MRPITSCLSLILAGTLVVAAMTGVATSRPDYCGQPDFPRLRVDMASAADARSPTLAPTQKVVFVQVQADKSDLEIGWAEK